MRYADGLETQFKNGNAKLGLLALTHLAGFSARLPDRLSLARQANPKEDIQGLQQQFEILLTGDVRPEAGVAPQEDW